MSADTAPAAMPGVEEIHELLLKTQRSFQAERDAKLAGQGLWPDRSPAPLDVLAKAVSDLFAPILAEKDAQVRAGEIMTQKMRELAARQKAAGKEYYDRALAAEAALAAEREDAARYRHLRANFLREAPMGRMTWYLPTRYPLTAESLDETIDRNIAAIRAQGE